MTKSKNKNQARMRIKVAVRCSVSCLYRSNSTLRRCSDLVTYIHIYIYKTFFARLWTIRGSKKKRSNKEAAEISEPGGAGDRVGRREAPRHPFSDGTPHHANDVRCEFERHHHGGQNQNSSDFFLKLITEQIQSATASKLNVSKWKRIEMTERIEGEEERPQFMIKTIPLSVLSVISQLMDRRRSNFLMLSQSFQLNT